MILIACDFVGLVPLQVPNKMPLYIFTLLKDLENKQVKISQKI